jgi:hypothetical protein
LVIEWLASAVSKASASAALMMLMGGRRSLRRRWRLKVEGCKWRQEEGGPYSTVTQT